MAKKTHRITISASAMDRLEQLATAINAKPAKFIELAIHCPDLIARADYILQLEDIARRRAEREERVAAADQRRTKREELRAKREAEAEQRRAERAERRKEIARVKATGMTKRKADAVVQRFYRWSPARSRPSNEYERNYLANNYSTEVFQEEAARYNDARVLLSRLPGNENRPTAEMLASQWTSELKRQC